MMHSTELVPGHTKSRGRVGHVLLVISLVLLSAGWAGAQEPEESLPPLMPIPLSDIPTRAAAERTALEQAERLLARAEIFDHIEDDLLSRERTIIRDLVSLRPALAAASSRQALSEIENTWRELDRLIEDSETELQRRTGVLQQQLSRLDVSLKIWQLTVQQAQEAKAPEELVNLARGTADEVAKIHTSLRHMQNRALALQGKAGWARGGVREALDRIQAEETSLLSNLVQRERPPLWSEAIADVSLLDLAARARHELGAWWSSILAVVRSESDRVGFQVFLLLVAAMILRQSRKAARAWTEADPSIAKGMSVFERPGVSSSRGRRSRRGRPYRSVGSPRPSGDGAND